MNDLISRQAAIDALDEIESEVADGYGYQYEKWRKYFCGLPSAQPEPVKHAHWIPDERETGEGSNTYKCSACGEIQMLIEGTPNENGWKYCPNCGARMDND